MNLQQHVTYSCPVKKYGTRIYRVNSDLKSALAQALWKLRCRDETKTHDQPEHRVVLEDLNRRACLHITNYLAKYSKQQFEFIDFNIDAEIEAIDPKLWEAICFLTRSTSEKKGLSKVSDPSSPAHHKKNSSTFLTHFTTLLHQ